MMVEHMEVSPKPTLDIVKAHKDYQQVVLDVKRSLKRFPPGIDDDYRLVLMDQLTVLIIRVLMKHPDLHYYQARRTMFCTVKIIIVNVWRCIVTKVFGIILKIPLSFECRK